MKPCEREHPPNAGLTLIEAVLALGLMGLILAALLAVSSSGLSAWLDTRDALWDIRREANWTDELRSSLAAMVPLVVPTASGSGGQSVYFQGEPQAMRFISAHSPAYRGRGGIRLVSLLASSSEQGRSLLFADAPCPDLQRLGQILAGPIRGQRPIKTVPIDLGRDGQPVSATMAENVTGCKFQYLRVPARAGQESSWVSRWDTPNALPQAVRIEWTVGRERDHSPAPLGETVVIAASVIAAVAPIDVVSGPRQAGRDWYAFD